MSRMNRDEFFAAVKLGDQFCIYDKHGHPEAQVYTATSEVAQASDPLVDFEYPVGQNRRPGAIRWSQSADETFEILEGR